jgi:8-amino-7-oxononanoate synthase
MNTTSMQANFAAPPSLLTHNAAYSRFKQNQRLAAQFGASPFFRLHEGVNDSRLTVEGGQLVDNFSSYNYLNLAAHPAVMQAARQALETFGASVCASRPVSGEIGLHRELESEIASFLGTDDCITYVSGYATNVSTIGHLFDRRDLIVHDEQMHNSGMVGCRLSGARSLAFRHNDVEDLERLLVSHRARHRRVLILVEGVYSMEGDVAPLPSLVALKEKYQALLMVDEAHSIGVLGASGRGVGEHFAVDRESVDLWMGTLSKALASCGGYIAGRADLVEYLRWTSPGFVYSVGMPPVSAAAGLAALRQLRSEPERVSRLKERAGHFLKCAKSAGLDTGLSNHSSIAPVIVGEAAAAVRIAHALFREGIQVAPIFYPAVGRNQARLRFFITAQHTHEQIERAVACLAQVVASQARQEAADATA